MSKVFTIAEGLENMGALRTGGQGSVYKGKRMGAIITAVKILPTPIHNENTEDKNYRNFISEVQKLKKVNEIPNPNVVKILNSGLTESGSFPFIEMEYIEGPDLEDLLKPPHSPVFTIRETIKLAEQLSNALCHCHRVGVKHGDIKSNNVKFNTDTGNYILLDFGLAIMSDEQRRSSVQHAGAVEFMAPEQHDGEMFFQTDVYSFGVVLYELLAGRVPFPLNTKGETSRNAVMLSHIEKPVPDLLTLRRHNLPEDWDADVQSREMNVPAWLLDLIKKCLEKNPENRFENGSLLKDAITHHNHAEPIRQQTITVVPPNPPEQTEVTADQTDVVKVSKPIFSIMILLLVVFGAFSAYSLFFVNNDNKKIIYEDTENLPLKDTLSENAAQFKPDTAQVIKPVPTDTVAQQQEIDSLQLEFEEQTGHHGVKPAVPANPAKDPSAEPVIISKGKKYMIPKTATYFYDTPNPDATRHGVLGLWVNTKFTVVDEQNGFILVTHTNNDGEITRGWLSKNDLKELP
ncbi:serine/threonine protein kinase [Pedobacter metabolipauper]|uniref:Serine/threonine-protein kinase n=1 Tax=Pedobacter metabolipauper TaxID=425513 RepID=A0A4R6SRZ0_9SPHI|nr:serine/threonine-protein kinase [Pedobacter metabolipauper]TDQ07363.1 serine/threonine-protein kinase [Pedobacter metabolipauper]